MIPAGVSRTLVGMLAVTALGCGDGGTGSGPVPPPASLRIEPIDSILTEGGTRQLTATYLDSTGHPVPGETITWSSEEPSVALVSRNGLVSARVPGAVLITARGAGFWAQQGMTVIDSQIVTRLDLHASPFGIAVSGTTAYLTLPLADSVRVLNTTTATVVTTLAIGSAPTAVVFNPSGSRAYVANQGGTLGVIDPSSNTVLTPAVLPGGAYAAVVSSDGGTIWVTMPGRRQVAAVDAATLLVSDSGPAPVVSQGLASDPTLPRLFVSGLGGFIGDTNLYELDAVTLDSVRSWLIDGWASTLVVAPDGTRLFVADQSAHLTVIPLSTGIPQPAMPLVGGAQGITLSPDGTKLAISEDRGVVEVFDVATLQLVKTINVGGIPRGLAYTPSGSRLLVANEAGWVDFIR